MIFVPMMVFAGIVSSNKNYDVVGEFYFYNQKYENLSKGKIDAVIVNVKN
jgi:hypothetical protein